MTCHPFPLAVLLGGLVALPAIAQQQAVKTLDVQVRSESWLNREFDLSDLKRRCLAAGIKLVPTGGKDGMLAIDYEEQKGSGYASSFGWAVASPSDYGTNAYVRFTLISMATGKDLLKLEAHGSTPSSVPSLASLHSLAVEALRKDASYRLACSAMAGMLGSNKEAAKLLPWAVASRTALAILDTAGFKANTPLETAYLAVARRDPAAIRQAGTATAEPLKLYLDSVHNEDTEESLPAKEDMEGNDPKLPYEERTKRFAQQVGEMVDLYITSGGNVSLKTLEGLATRMRHYGCKADQSAPALVPTLKAIGLKGNAHSLGLVEGMTKFNDCSGKQDNSPDARDIQAAASSASDAIRRRLVKK